MIAEPSPALACTPHARIERVEAVINPASGGVGPKAAAGLQAILDRFDFQANVAEAPPGGLPDVLRKAVDAKPDLLVVLAGDGTIRAAGELCGPDGPILAALPGGTMNMLPQALYGTTDWRKALEEALTEGVIRNVCGGEVGGQFFYCAAIFGHPALWAEAREAVREGKFSLAFRRGQRALRRAFKGKLYYRLDDGPYDRSEALTFLTPLISKAMADESALEAAVLDPAGAIEAFRLAFNAIVRDWRDDPAVESKPVLRAVLNSRSKIPAILDGEPVKLGKRAEVRFAPKAFRALAPRLESTRS